MHCSPKTFRFGGRVRQTIQGVASARARGRGELPALEGGGAETIREGPNFDFRVTGSQIGAVRCNAGVAVLSGGIGWRCLTIWWAMLATASVRSGLGVDRAWMRRISSGEVCAIRSALACLVFGDGFVPGGDVRCGTIQVRINTLSASWSWPVRELRTCGVVGFPVGQEVCGGG